MLTHDQLAARKGKITSSVAAACLGLHPYCTPMQAKRRILGLDTFEGNKATERGDLLEDLILKYPLEVIKSKKDPNDTVCRIFQRAEFRNLKGSSWASDSCDAVYLTNLNVHTHYGEVFAIGEGKTANLHAAEGYGEEGTDQVPLHVMIQCHWHLIHWPEVDLCYVPVLVGGYTFEFRLYEIRRDKEIEGRLLESLGKWHHEYIVLDKEPQAKAGDLDYLGERYHTNCEPLEQVQLGGELDRIVTDYMRLKDAAKKAKQLEDTARAQLQAVIGPRDGYESDGWRVTYKSNKSSSKVDYEHLAKDLLDKHCDAEQKEKMICTYAKTVQGARVLRASLKEIGK